MQYLRRILLCDVNRYHIVPGTFVRLPRNLGRLFRQPVLVASLAPGEESLGATTEALKGFASRLSLGPVWLCEINKVDQNVDHICVSVSLVFHRFLTILPMFWVIFWTSSELLLISWQEQWHEVVMDSDQTRRDLTLEVSRREGRPEKLQGVEKWKRKSVPPSHYSWDSSGVKWIQMDSDNAFPHYIQ